MGFFFSIYKCLACDAKGPLIASDPKRSQPSTFFFIFLNGFRFDFFFLKRFPLFPVRLFDRNTSVCLCIKNTPIKPDLNKKIKKYGA
jgi:hypothetical protein